MTIAILIFMFLEVIYAYYLFKTVIKNKKSHETRFYEMIKLNTKPGLKFFLYQLVYALFVLVLFIVIPMTLIYLLLKYITNIWVSVSLALIILIATVFLGIMYSVYWQFYPYLIVEQIEKRKKFEFKKALKQSHKLVKGKWWPIFAFDILLALILLGISLVGYVINSLISLASVGSLSLPILGLGFGILLVALSMLISVLVSFFELPIKIILLGEAYKQLKK